VVAYDTVMIFMVFLSLGVETMLASPVHRCRRSRVHFPGVENQVFRRTRPEFEGR